MVRCHVANRATNAPSRDQGVPGPAPSQRARLHAPIPIQAASGNSCEGRGDPSVWKLQGTRGFQAHRNPPGGKGGELPVVVRCLGALGHRVLVAFAGRGSGFEAPWSRRRSASDRPDPRRSEVTALMVLPSSSVLGVVGVRLGWDGVDVRPRCVNALERPVSGLGRTSDVRISGCNDGSGPGAWRCSTSTVHVPGRILTS